MRIIYFCISFCCILLLSIGCIKAPIEFVDNNRTGDPNITFFDNYKVEIATYRTDSFVTSGHETFMIGQHQDSLSGQITASSYSQIVLPENNPIQDKTVIYDSLVLILKPTGNYFGDTLKPFTIDVYRMADKIKNDEEENTFFYNPRSFSVQPSIFGSTSIVIRPKITSEINIRLSDNFGRELLNKFRTNNTDIQTLEDFASYFRGVCIKSSSNGNNLFFFRSFDKNILMRLHYRLNSSTSQEKTLDFAFNTSYQFNQVVHNSLNSPLAIFTPFKKQLKESPVTNNKSILHNNIGSIIKVSFPTIFSIKELHPYVKILKAELVIKPGSVYHRYPYVLPKELFLYTTNDNNDLISIIKDASGQNDQNGNLAIDNLFPDKTQYSFDVTQYINFLLGEGRFSKSALMISPKSLFSDIDTERLILNDQTIDKSIQLKLYVLGL